MRSSDFIDNSIDIGKAEPIDKPSTTSIFYRTKIDDRLYFIKQLRTEYTDNPRYRALFRKEFENGKAVRHPNIVEYVGIDENEDGLYIIIEHINGVTLADKINNEPQFFKSKDNLYRITLQLLEALKALHEKNIVYSDLSPKNIMLTKTNNQVKLIDLGFSISNDNNFTAGCTPAFASPEAMDGTVNEIDHRSDFYALGALLQHIEEKTGTKLTGKLLKIKKRCLQQQKTERYATANEIIKEIKNRQIVFWQKIAAAIATVFLLSALLVKCGLYTMIVNYICWESGRYPVRFEAGGIFYNITNEDTRAVEVTFKGEHPDEYEYEYEGGEINIPPTVTYKDRTFTVTGIAGQAFKNPYITQIYIPEGIKTIKDSALIYCILNGTLNIPKSVEYFGVSNLLPNTYIDSITVHKDNRYYDSRNGCNAIIETATNTIIAGCKNTVIPYGVERIARDAFVGGKEMKSIAFPASIKDIDEAAFHSCALTSVEIPEGVKTLKQYTFQYCENMQRVTLPKSLRRIELAALSHCGFNELTIPDSVYFVGSYAFDYCEELEAATIGGGVKEIGDAAFENCKKLKKIISNIPAENLFEIDNSVFRNIHEDCILYVPKGARATYQKARGWNKFENIKEFMQDRGKEQG